MEFLSKNLEETAQIARGFGTGLKNGDRAKVVGLYGDLGAGKTTFMKYLAESLGLKEAVQSPTFVIEKIYELEDKSFKHLIHIDAYRIEEGSEMITLGWNEIIADPQNLICIEWPERIADIMPPHIKIFFEHMSENERKITIETNEEN